MLTEIEVRTNYEKKLHELTISAHDIKELTQLADQYKAFAKVVRAYFCLSVCQCMCLCVVLVSMFLLIHFYFILFYFDLF